MILAFLVVSVIYIYCIYHKCVHQLDDHWLVQTIATVTPIPTYVVLLVMPFDNHLAEAALKDHVVVAIAGLYGIIQTSKTIQRTARAARTAKSQDAAESSLI